MKQKYLFILGRNPELSIAELEAFFRKNGWNFQQIQTIENGLLIESSEDLEGGIIKKLGGIVSFGKILAEGNSDEIFLRLKKTELHNTKSNKLNYVIYNFKSKIFPEIEDYLKQRFKSEKLKATEKKLTGNIKMQSGDSTGKVSSSLIDEEYFIFSEKDKAYFGKILESSNYKEIEKRDMEKPIRRNELAISPRLAKILVNLSEVPHDGTLLDPFCGIGIILEEALLQGTKVIGIDKDGNALENAKKNLEWFGFNKDYRLINEDSSKVKISEKISGIATEPDFGKLLKSPPSEVEAAAIIRKFENLISRVLNNLKKNLVNGKSRIAFTAPLILTKNKKRVGCDFSRISNSTRLKILAEPIAEFREGKIVGRSFIVMGR